MHLLNRFMSLLYYMVAAEAGYAPAQFNVAYLCEQHTVSSCSIILLLFPSYFCHSLISCFCLQSGVLDMELASNCMWRFYNLTIQSENPDTYGK